MIPDPLDPGLCASLPPIRRAREYRLYDLQGRRYLDLWQLDGHAILGHRATGVSTAIKNSISRGLAMDLPSPAGRLLERAVRALVPSHPFVRLYGSLDRALGALSGLLGRRVDVRDVRDPVFPEGEASPDAVTAWRPALPGRDWERARVLLPVLPFSACGGPWAVCLREDPAGAMPPSEPLSAALLEGATRSCGALGRYATGALAPETAKAGCPRWRTAGPYVAPCFPRERYPEVFASFLGKGVILSPHWECPSVLPAVLSEGEMRKAVGLFRSIPAE